ncbi:MAG: hypothetical protein ACLP2F_11160 [Steroidobacteraceae bacterium]
MSPATSSDLSAAPPVPGIQYHMTPRSVAVLFAHLDARSGFEVKDAAS